MTYDQTIGNIRVLANNNGTGTYQLRQEDDSVITLPFNSRVMALRDILASALAFSAFMGDGATLDSRSTDPGKANIGWSVSVADSASSFALLTGGAWGTVAAFNAVDAESVRSLTDDAISALS